MGMGINLDAARELYATVSGPSTKPVVPFVYSHFSSSPMMGYQAEHWTVIDRLDTDAILRGIGRTFAKEITIVNNVIA
jgi:hypothetical protein